MPITPYTRPVESTFVDTRPQFPLRSIAAAATQLQQRQDVVRDELDELRNAIVQNEPLAQNREVFARATEGIRNEIATIAEEGELFNRLSRVRQLSREFAETTQAFQKNQKNVQTALVELEDTTMPDRLKDQYRALITRQAALQLDGRGRVDPGSVFGGVSVGDETDIVQFALDRAKDMKERSVEQGTFQSAGNGLLRRTVQEGVSKDRVATEVLTSLGFAKDPETGKLYRATSSGNPEVENYFQNRRQLLRAQGLSEAEIQERFRKKAKRIVAEAQNKYAHLDTRYKFRSAPRSGDGGDGEEGGERISITGSVANLPTASEISKSHPKYEEVKDREQLVLQNMPDMTGGQITENEIQVHREIEEYIHRLTQDRTRDFLGAHMAGAGAGYNPNTGKPSFEGLIRDKFGEGAYDTWKAVEEKKKGLMKEVSFDSRIIGFSADRQNERKDAEEYLSQISGETLVSPDLDSDDLFGSTEAEKINQILKDPGNFTLQGVTEDGRYAVLIDHTNGNRQVRLRMDTPQADPVYRELTNAITGSPRSANARVLKKNNQLANVSITSDEFTPVGGEVSLSRSVAGYTAKAGGTGVTFDRYFQRLTGRERITQDDLTDIQRLAQYLTKVRVDGTSAREVGLTPRSAPQAVIAYLRQKAGDAGPGEGVPPDMKAFLDRAMDEHVPFDSRGQAALQAQRFSQLH